MIFPLLASPTGVVQAGTNAWTSLGLHGQTVTTLAIDPQHPTTLYAGTYSGGIFKSTDGGGAWNAANNGLTQTWIRSLAVNPQHPDTLYAATNSGGVFKTTNGASSWAPVNTHLGSLLAEALAIDPQTPETIYVGAGGNHLYRSSTGGNDWSATALAGDPAVIAIDPQTPATLYVSDGSAYVQKSVDSGDHWSTVFTGPVYTYTRALAIDPLHPQTIYLADSYTGLQKSIDGGAAWNPANTGLLDLALGNVIADPASSGTVYASSWYSGVYRSTDGGGHWSSFNTGLPFSSVETLAIDPQDPAAIYAGTQDGVYSIHLQTPQPTTSTTVTTVFLAPNPVGVRKPLTASARVHVPTGSAFPTGTVQFVVDGASFGAPVALSKGQASLAIDGLSQGWRRVSAAYAGDAKYTLSAAVSVDACVGCTDTGNLEQALVLSNESPGRLIHKMVSAGYGGKNLLEALQILKDQTGADDVISDAFLNALKTAPAGSPIFVTHLEQLDLDAAVAINTDGAWQFADLYGANTIGLPGTITAQHAAAHLGEVNFTTPVDRTQGLTNWRIPSTLYSLPLVINYNAFALVSAASTHIYLPFIRK